jgi:hypothetical protein
MSINLKVTLGTVNYTDWVHVTASKVSSPSVIVWEDWIDVPVSNYNFVIPGLDPENYWVRYYDAATNSSLGSLVAELLVNALTGDTIYERRFYLCGGGNLYDPANGATGITDPYLIGKNITGVFKEAFRYLVLDDEYSFDDSVGNVELLNGQQLNQDERISVEIKHNAGNISVPSPEGALYSGYLNITTSTYTLTSGDINKRIRCVGSSNTQAITLPSLAGISTDKGFYFDNSCGGVAVQVKLLLPGSDKIRFNGFAVSSNLFSEFWVSKGEHVLIRKFDDDYWEVITDYKGTNVGEKLSAGYSFHANTLKENGALIDGDEYPRLWWWINTVLPSTHKYITDTVTGSFVPDPNRIGQFAVHSTLKKFRMPISYGMVEKGHLDFDNLGADSPNRTVDYPGGFQDEMIKSHEHLTSVVGNDSWCEYGVKTGEANLRIENYTTNGFSTKRNKTSSVGGSEQRVKNIGVVFLRRI